MSVVSSATVAVRDRVPLVFWSTSTMVNPEHETGFAEIISSKPTSGQCRRSPPEKRENVTSGLPVIRPKKGSPPHSFTAYARDPPQVLV
jgi:hypothetical protein